jgi:hypothetical protein
LRRLLCRVENSKRQAEKLTSAIAMFPVTLRALLHARCVAGRDEWRFETDDSGSDIGCALCLVCPGIGRIDDMRVRWTNFPTFRADKGIAPKRPVPTAIWSPDKLPPHLRPEHCPIDPVSLTGRVVERFAASSGEPGLMAQTGQNRDQTNGEETRPTIVL